MKDLLKPGDAIKAALAVKLQADRGEEPGKSIADAHRAIQEFITMNTENTQPQETQADVTLSEELKQFFRSAHEASPEELEALQAELFGEDYREQIKKLDREVNPNKPPHRDPDSPDFDLERTLTEDAALNAVAGAWLEAKQEKEKLDRKGYRIEPGENGEPDSIILNVPEYDPELDPENPAFNRERFLQETSLTPEAFARMQKTVEDAKNRIMQSVKKIAFSDVTAVNELLESSLSRIAQTAQEAAQIAVKLNSTDFLLKVYESLLLANAELEEQEAAEPEEPAPDENQLTLFEDEAPQEKKEEKTATQRKINRAIESGALTSFKAAAFTTTTEFLNILTRDSIFLLPDGTAEDEFNEKTGQISDLNFMQKAPQQIGEAQTGLFGAILQAVRLSYSTENQENNALSIYVPSFLDALKVDVRSFSKRVAREKIPMQTLRRQKMLSLLQPFDRWIGRFPDGSYYRFLTIESYNDEAETIRIICPFLFEIVRRNDKNRYTFLAHPDIANERNQAAVEIAMRLLTGLQRRGTTIPDYKTFKSKAKPKKKTIKTKNADGTETTVIEEYPDAKQPEDLIDPSKPAVYTYEYSYKNIILDCPQIRHELNAIEHPVNDKGEPDAEKLKTVRQAYNSKLKQTFSAAFRILLEKTDAPLYYKNLHFTNVYPTGEYILPTRTTIGSTYIGIEHNGRNKAYKAK